MELSSSIVGTFLAPYHAEVSWRHLMNYAAAIQDDNPIYFDDKTREGIIGHPVSCAAITWPVMGNLSEYLEANIFPSKVLDTQVHYSEYLHLLRPLQPGDHLTINGKIAAVLPHRSGTTLFVRLDATDASGQPVFTEIAGALLRGVRCEDKGNVVDLLSPTPENPHHPRTLWQERVFIDPMQTYIYDGCSNIFFPIHTSGKFATEVGLPGIIVQGTAVLAHAVRVLINREVGGDSFRLKILYGRFSHMVFPGTEIIVQLQGAVDQQNGRALHFDVFNDRGQKALSDGYAFVKN